MITSHTTVVLSKPTGREPIPAGFLEYLQTRNRLHVFNLIQKEFEKCGITQADVASRLGKGTDRICHLLSAPGNWTLDTVSDLLFAMSGAEVEYRVAYPLDRPARNMTEPDWLHAFDSKSKIIQIALDGVSVAQTPFSQTDGVTLTYSSTLPELQYVRE